MASAAEQLAASVSWSALTKAEDLKKRIWFTLMALVVYRLGTYIPLPGVDPAVMAEFARSNSGGILGMIDMFSGGALGRMTIFALNIFPYISASIIVQLLTAVYPPFELLKKEGASGRKKLNQYTRYGTLILAVLQGYAVATGLEAMAGLNATVVLDPGFFFRITTVVMLTGATLFLMWLGEQITSRGIGNGISLIIFSGIVANLPSAALQMLNLGRHGNFSPAFMFILLVGIMGVIAFIVYMERAQRRVLVQYPKRQATGGRMSGGESSHLPLKLNSAGVIPPIFANSLLLLPLTLSTFLRGSEFFSKVTNYLAHGQPLYIVLYVLLIVFFAFFYTAVVFNPEETANNLKQSGGFVPGYRPGKHTADYFDYLLTRLTVLGAAYLAFVCVLPEFIYTKYKLPFYLGGTSLLIVVSVTLDTIAQVHSYLLAHQYEGLLKKTRLRGNPLRRG